MQAAVTCSLFYASNTFRIMATCYMVNMVYCLQNNYATYIECIRNYSPGSKQVSAPFHDRRQDAMGWWVRFTVDFSIQVNVDTNCSGQITDSRWWSLDYRLMCSCEVIKSIHFNAFTKPHKTLEFYAHCFLEN